MTSTRPGDRRAFLKATGMAVAGTALGGCAPCAGDASPRQALSPDLLRALAGVVLPLSTLGPERMEDTVTAFEAWVEGFEPVAELEHGYGTSEIRYGPPDPAPGWEAQLRGLDLESRRRFDLAFTALPAADRRTLVAGQLRGAGDSLPGPSSAPHVALGLLAHFYDSAMATDLCYERAIRKQTCRGIGRAAELPAPLQGSARIERS